MGVEECRKESYMLSLITIFTNLCLSKEMIVFQDVGELFIKAMCK
jgi:hypothetical protein